MLRIPDSIFTEYVAHLRSRNIPPARNVEYRKWLRYYLDFCNKYPVPNSKAERVRLFCDKLREKRQTDAQRERAAHAVSLYFEMLNCETGCLPEDVPGLEVCDPSLASLAVTGREALQSGDKATMENALPRNESIHPPRSREDGEGAQEPLGLFIVRQTESTA